METTLILFKPDAVQKSLVGTVLARFEADGLAVRGIKVCAKTKILAGNSGHAVCGGVNG